MACTNSNSITECMMRGYGTWEVCARCTARSAPPRHAASFTHTAQFSLAALSIDRQASLRGYFGGDAACASTTTLLRSTPKPNPARSPPAPAMPAGLMTQQSAVCSAATASGRVQGAGRAVPRRHAMSGAAVGRPAPAGLGCGLSATSRAQGRRVGAVRVQAAATPQLPGANGAAATEGPFDWLTDEWKEADRKNLRTVSLPALPGLLGWFPTRACMPPAGPVVGSLPSSHPEAADRSTTRCCRHRHYHSRRCAGGLPFDLQRPNCAALVPPACRCSILMPGSATAAPAATGATCPTCPLPAL